jgi:hypothetical protein
MIPIPASFYVLAQPRQPLPGVLNLGLAGVGVLPEAEKVFILAAWRTLFPLLIFPQVKQRESTFCFFGYEITIASSFDIQKTLV